MLPPPSRATAGFDASSGAELFAGGPLPHFNEVDEGSAVDALINNRVWTDMELNPSTTLHDVLWGERYRSEGLDAFVWVFEISGAVPTNHFVGGFAGTISERQPPMHFPAGGGTVKGISQPGEIV